MSVKLDIVVRVLDWKPGTTGKWVDVRRPMRIAANPDEQHRTRTDIFEDAHATALVNEVNSED